MAEVINAEDVFRKICVASRMENLGLFIGSGFSKALMKESNKDMLSWLELLKALCNEYTIDNSIFNEGSTYPLIASKIIESVSEIEKVNNEVATRKVKNSIAKLVNCPPTKEITDKYHNYFYDINPQWIVTTNYDSLIEKVVGSTAYPILPNYLFFKAKNMMPIYHIHGSILDPSSIVITNDDYAKTMRPADYRHSRLPILFKESTVLMIGYALGDLNVISAIDYRNNVFTNTSNVDNCIIQLVYNEKISEPNVYLKSNIIIYEYNDLSSFFSNLSNYINKYKSIIGKQTNEVQNKQNEFINEESFYINLFINNDENYRDSTISFINKLDISYNYIFAQYIPFLERVFDSIFSFAHMPNQFSYYDDYLNILIDLLKDIEVDKMEINYLSFLVDKFKEIAPYIGDENGRAWDAYKTFCIRKKEIPYSFIEMITNTIEVETISNLKRLIDEYNS